MSSRLAPRAESHLGTFVDTSEGSHLKKVSPFKGGSEVRLQTFPWENATKHRTQVDKSGAPNALCHHRA